MKVNPENQKIPEPRCRKCKKSLDEAGQKGAKSFVRVSKKGGPDIWECSPSCS